MEAAKISEERRGERGYLIKIAGNNKVIKLQHLLKATWQAVYNVDGSMDAQERILL
jgi:hypothetical protein